MGDSWESRLGEIPKDIASRPWGTLSQDFASRQPLGPALHWGIGCMGNAMRWDRVKAQALDHSTKRKNQDDEDLRANLRLERLLEADRLRKERQKRKTLKGRQRGVRSPRGSRTRVPKTDRDSTP